MNPTGSPVGNAGWLHVVLAGWHEYFAFLFAVQAVFTGLVTLVWLLIFSTPDAPTAVDDG